MNSTITNKAHDAQPTMDRRNKQRRQGGTAGRDIAAMRHHNDDAESLQRQGTAIDLLPLPSFHVPQKLKEAVEIRKHLATAEKEVAIDERRTKSTSPNACGRQEGNDATRLILCPPTREESQQSQDAAPSLVDGGGGGDVASPSAAPTVKEDAKGGVSPTSSNLFRMITPAVNRNRTLLRTSGGFSSNHHFFSSNHPASIVDSSVFTTPSTSVSPAVSASVSRSETPPPAPSLLPNGGGTSLKNSSPPFSTQHHHGGGGDVASANSVRFSEPVTRVDGIHATRAAIEALIRPMLLDLAGDVVTIEVGGELMHALYTMMDEEDEDGEEGGDDQGRQLHYRSSHGGGGNDTSHSIRAKNEEFSRKLAELLKRQQAEACRDGSSRRLNKRGGAGGGVGFFRSRASSPFSSENFFRGGGDDDDDIDHEEIARRLRRQLYLKRQRQQQQQQQLSGDEQPADNDNDEPTNHPCVIVADSNTLNRMQIDYRIGNPSSKGVEEDTKEDPADPSARFGDDEEDPFTLQYHVGLVEKQRNQRTGGGLKTDASLSSKHQQRMGGGKRLGGSSSSTVTSVPPTLPNGLQIIFPRHREIIENGERVARSTTPSPAAVTPSVVASSSSSPKVAKNASEARIPLTDASSSAFLHHSSSSFAAPPIIPPLGAQHQADLAALQLLQERNRHAFLATIRTTRRIEMVTGVKRDLPPQLLASFSYSHGLCDEERAIVDGRRGERGRGGGGAMDGKGGGQEEVTTTTSEATATNSQRRRSSSSLASSPSKTVKFLKRFIVSQDDKANSADAGNVFSSNAIITPILIPSTVLEMAEARGYGHLFHRHPPLLMPTTADLPELEKTANTTTDGSSVSASASPDIKPSTVVLLQQQQQASKEQQQQLLAAINPALNTAQSLKPTPANIITAAYAPMRHVRLMRVDVFVSAAEEARVFQQVGKLLRNLRRAAGGTLSDVAKADISHKIDLLLRAEELASELSVQRYLERIVHHALQHSDFAAGEHRNGSSGGGDSSASPMTAMLRNFIKIDVSLLTNTFRHQNGRSERQGAKLVDRIAAAASSSAAAMLTATASSLPPRLLPPLYNNQQRNSSNYQNHQNFNTSNAREASNAFYSTTLAFTPSSVEDTFQPPSEYELSLLKSVSYAPSTMLVRRAGEEKEKGQDVSAASLKEADAKRKGAHGSSLSRSSFANTTMTATTATPPSATLSQSASPNQPSSPQPSHFIRRCCFIVLSAPSTHVPEDAIQRAHDALLYAFNTANLPVGMLTTSKTIPPQARTLSSSSSSATMTNTHPQPPPLSLACSLQQKFDEHISHATTRIASAVDCTRILPELLTNIESKVKAREEAERRGFFRRYKSSRRQQQQLAQQQQQKANNLIMLKKSALRRQQMQQGGGDDDEGVGGVDANGGGGGFNGDGACAALMTEVQEDDEEDDEDDTSFLFNPSGGPAVFTPNRKINQLRAAMANNNSKRGGGGAGAGTMATSNRSGNTNQPQKSPATSKSGNNNHQQHGVNEGAWDAIEEDDRRTIILNIKSPLVVDVLARDTEILRLAYSQRPMKESPRRSDGDPLNGEEALQPFNCINAMMTMRFSSVGEGGGRSPSPSSPVAIAAASPLNISTTTGPWSPTTTTIARKTASLTHNNNTQSSSPLAHVPTVAPSPTMSFPSAGGGGVVPDGPKGSVSLSLPPISSPLRAGAAAAGAALGTGNIPSKEGVVESGGSGGVRLPSISSSAASPTAFSSKIAPPPPLSLADVTAKATINGYGVEENTSSTPVRNTASNNTSPMSVTNGKFPLTATTLTTKGGSMSIASPMLSSHTNNNNTLMNKNGGGVSSSNANNNNNHHLSKTRSSHFGAVESQRLQRRLELLREPEPHMLMNFESVDVMGLSSGGGGGGVGGVNNGGGGGQNNSGGKALSDDHRDL